MKYLIAILPFIVSACGHGKQLPYPEYLRNPERVDTVLLRFDGYYTLYDTTKFNDGRISNDVYLGIRKVIFTEKNKVWIDHGADVDQRTLSCGYFKKYAQLKDMGTYTIEGNKILAFVPVYVVGYGPWGPGSSYTYWLNYTGEIKNRDTIVNWRAVAPFPKTFTRAKRKDVVNEDIVLPQMICFKKLDAVRCAGSNERQQ